MKSPQNNDNTSRWKLRHCIDVPGQPVGKGRPRFARLPKGVKAYTPKKTKDYEQRVSWLTPYRPTSGPIRVEIVAIFKRPKSMSRKKDPAHRILHTKKPDLDNVIKSAIDGISGRAMEDDSQVCRIEGEKWYAAKSEEPHTEINIYEMIQTNNQGTTTDDMAPSTERADHSSSSRDLEQG